MNFSFIQSLQHLATAKIVIQLWTQNHDVTTIIRKNLYFTKDAAAKMLENLEQNPLPIPHPVNEKVVRFIPAIGEQIHRWYTKHNYKIYRLHRIQRHAADLRWTSAGSIDGRETTKVLIRDQRLSLDLRYHLACANCLVDEIHTLFTQLPEEELDRCILEEWPPRDERGFPRMFWSHLMTRKLYGLRLAIHLDTGIDCCPYYYAFGYAVAGSNLAATKFFFGKLSSDDREMFLRYPETVFRRLEDKEKMAEVGCFLLSVLGKSQRMTVMKMWPRKLLPCFLRWPYQHLFMEIAEKMRDFISEEDFDILEEKIDSFRQKERVFGDVLAEFQRLKDGAKKMV